jgi:hypothetical protein
MVGNWLVMARVEGRGFTGRNTASKGISLWQLIPRIMLALTMKRD